MKAVLAWAWRQAFVRFAAVGGAGYLINAAALTVFTRYLGLGVDAALASSIFVAMCFTWAGNRYLTFASRRAHGLSGIVEEWLRFVGANLLGAIVNYGVALALVHYGSGWLGNPYVAQACGVLAGLVFNFTLSRLLVFRSDGPAG
ncbi:MAG: GtrA family protein [Alphaproteobacteria bacterium]|nr:GtrA family protein [Alphaproteobacteria bacterium]